MPTANGFPKDAGIADVTKQACLRGGRLSGGMSSQYHGHWHPALGQLSCRTRSFSMGAPSHETAPQLQAQVHYYSTYAASAHPLASQGLCWPSPNTVLHHWQRHMHVALRYSY